MMNDKIQKMLETIVPYLVLGIAVALLLGFLFLFSYVLIWGLIIGSILWLGSLVIQFFSSKPNHQEVEETKKGRIIEHDDKK